MSNQGKDKKTDHKSDDLPRKPEDTDDSGDAKSGVGEDNHQDNRPSQ